ncbi:MAG: hypothetical protein ACYDER_29290 [Ktedonobacteraceae bacterium]
MKIKQAILKNINGNEVMTTWLDVRPGLKAGAIVSLKDFKPEERWRVEELFEPAHELDQIEEEILEFGYSPHVNDWCGFGQGLGL